MCASPFQKWHKRRKAHDDHNVTSDTDFRSGTSEEKPTTTTMSQVTLPSSRALLLCACAERTSPFSSIFFFRLHLARKCRRKNTCKRKPCTHDNDACRTSVTAARKRCFPLFRSAAFLSFPVAHRAIPHSFPFSFRLSSRYANVPMPPFQTPSVVIFVAGAKVIPGLYGAARSGRLAVARKNLHPRRLR